MNFVKEEKNIVPVKLDKEEEIVKEEKVKEEKNEEVDLIKEINKLKINDKKEMEKNKDDEDDLIKKINKLKVNDKKLTKKQIAIDLLFQPDYNGISKWIDREMIDKDNELAWGNNGVTRQGILHKDNRYIWEFKRQNNKPSAKILAVRTNGYNKDFSIAINRPIREDIKLFYKKIPCVVCGSKSDLVTDHKNDLYNDPRVLCTKTQTIDDFQSLCNHCNLQKRQILKKTIETNKRYSAKNIPSLAIFNIDFIEGDKTFNIKDINAMKGTYWYDPIEFMKQVIKKKEID